MMNLPLKNEYVYIIPIGLQSNPFINKCTQNLIISFQIKYYWFRTKTASIGNSPLVQWAHKKYGGADEKTIFQKA